MNRALRSEYAWADHHLPLNRANYAVLVLALVAAGYDGNRYAILQPLCNTDKVMVEKRKSEWTQLYLNALAAKVDLESLPNISECELIGSSNVDLSGVAASVTINPTGTNNDILFTARYRGSAGNDISVTYTDPGANSQPLAATITGSAIVVSLATGAGGAITSTANDIVAFLNTKPAFTSIAKAEALGTGAGIVTAIAKTNLSGGLN